MKSNKNFLISGLIFFLLAGGAGYIFKDFSSSKGGIISATTENAENTQENKAENEDSGNISVDIVSVSEGDVVVSKPGISAPNLDGEIKVPENTPERVKKQTLTEIQRIIGLLKQDSNLFNEWSELGLMMKSINDYAQARDAWEYAAALRPNDSLIFTNLANLYGYYMKEPEKAEKNYLQSIENDPKVSYLYVRAALFYLEVLGDKEKAGSILEKGLKNIPGDDELEGALEEVKRF